MVVSTRSRRSKGGTDDTPMPGEVEAVSVKKPARLMRALLLLFGLFFLEHIVCAMANKYTTMTYLRLAQDPTTSAQYLGPLYDMGFTGRREEVCEAYMQTIYDLALWLLGVHCYLNAVSTYMTDIGSFVGEHFFVCMMAHTLFMCAAQVATTLPASGGLKECIAANGGATSVDQWPWWGVSFLTQSFSGARACGDMIYSGHITNIVILALLGDRYYINQLDKRWHRFVSVVLGAVACILIVRCEDHYSVDVILGIGIAWLLCTNPILEGWAVAWARRNQSLEGYKVDMED